MEEKIRKQNIIFSHDIFMEKKCEFYDISERVSW